MSDNEKLLPVTVRFTNKVYTAIQELAAQHNVSIATVVRLAVNGNLSRYLGSLQYVNEAQADLIYESIIAACNEMADIRRELNRIGVNFNQAVKLRNIEEKYKSEYAKIEKYSTYERIKQKTRLDTLKAKEISEVEVRASGCPNLNLTNYLTVTKKRREGCVKYYAVYKSKQDKERTRSNSVCVRK